MIRKKTIRQVRYGDSAEERRAAAAAAKRAEARRRAAAERKRKEALARKQAEEKRRAELARKQAEEKRRAEEKRKAELARKAAEEKRRAELARKALDDKRKTQNKSDGAGTWNYVWKSALLPGWGHWSNGATTTGWIYTGSFAALLAATVVTNSAATSAEATYNGDIGTNLALGSAVSTDSDSLGLALLNSLTSSGSNFSSFKSAADNFNTALALTGALYIGQLVHAWISGSSAAGKIAADEPGNSGRLEFTLGRDFTDTTSDQSPRRMEIRYGFRF